MIIKPISNTIYDVFRALSDKEKMDSVSEGFGPKSEDSTNGWGKWTRIRYTSKSNAVSRICGAPLLKSEEKKLIEHFGMVKKS